jgi:hypothetical protein
MATKRAIEQVLDGPSVFAKKAIVSVAAPPAQGVLLFVVFVQFVVVDQLDQAPGITGIGRITRCLQAVAPRFKIILQT